jgi:hypothetical protein
MTYFNRTISFTSPTQVLLDEWVEMRNGDENGTASYNQNEINLSIWNRYSVISSVWVPQ